MRPVAVEPGARLRTRLSCSLRARRPMLCLPPEMGALQPENLAWLRGFARRHGFGLAEDRRRANGSSVEDLPCGDERHGGEPSELARGIALLLSQAGMPGVSVGEGDRPLPTPGHGGADTLDIGLDRLVRMAAHARPRSKRVVLLPNRLLVATTGQDTHPIIAHACRLSTPGGTTVLSQFDSPSLRCLGYASGTQYVVHVLLGGGRAAAPELWTRLHTLTRTDFRFRLFPGAGRTEDFGLFHATFRYDLASGKDAPWWIAPETFDEAARGLRRAA